MEEQAGYVVMRVLIGILSASSGVGAAFLTRRWWETRLMVVTSEAKFVDSDWSGTFTQGRNRKAEETILTASLKAKWKRVSGTLTYDSEEIRCSGGFFQSRVLTLHYWTSNPGVLQHGSIVVRLSDLSDKLDGYFVGHGPTKEGLIHGSVLLERVKDAD